MRPALLAGLVLAAAPTFGFAQTGPYLATVTDAGVKLRAGPSDAFPATSTLPKGATLLVDREEPNGWLAVQDPPGKMYSMSWIQASFIDFDNTKPTPQNVVVQAETTLAPGQIGNAQPMTVYRRVTVPMGTALTVIGAKVQFEGKWWHPVLPPPSDFRYLPKQAVKFEQAANATFAVRDVTPAAAVASIPGAAKGGALPPTGPATTSSKPAVSNPLWAQAEAAEREGRLDDAEKLFFQLARDMNATGGDHDIANMCYTRIHALREKKRAASGTSTIATTTPRKPVGEPTRPVGTVSAPPALDPRDDRPRWNGPGKLVRTGLVLDERSIYALESNPGVRAFYVVAGQGVDLDKVVGKKVEIYGANYVRTGLSKPYVVATDVEVKP